MPRIPSPERPERIRRQLASDQRSDALFALHLKLCLRQDCISCFSIASLVLIGAPNRDVSFAALLRLLDRFTLEVKRLQGLTDLSH